MIMHRLRSVLRLGLLLAPLTLLPPTAVAAEPEVVIVLRDGRFEPAEVRVKAGVKIKLVIDNQDKAAAEFEQGRDARGIRKQGVEAREDRAAGDPRDHQRRTAEARPLSLL